MAASAQGQADKPSSETAAPAQQQPVPPNMLHLKPAWPMSPPIVGLDPPKGVRTTRILLDVRPARYFAEVTGPATGPEGSGPASDARAEEALATLRKDFPALVPDVQTLIRRVNAADKALHRVLLGPLETYQKAQATCDVVRTAGGECSVSVE